MVAYPGTGCSWTNRTRSLGDTGDSVTPPEEWTNVLRRNTERHEMKRACPGPPSHKEKPDFPAVFRGNGMIYPCRAVRRFRPVRASYDIRGGVEGGQRKGETTPVDERKKPRESDGDREVTCTRDGIISSQPAGLGIPDLFARLRSRGMTFLRTS